MAALKVTRLLQNPLGQLAPAGQRGDIVRVSDGAATVYLDPAEFELSSEQSLRAMLALAGPRGEVAPEPDPAAPGDEEADGSALDVRPRRRRKPPEPIERHDAAGSLTDPRRAGRRAQSIW